MRYQPHRPFVAPAAARAEVWRTAGGVVLTFVAGTALFQFFFAILAPLLGPDATQALIDATSFGAAPAATLFTLFSFGFFAVGLAMVLHGIHDRAFATLFGPWEAVVSDCIRVTLGVGALYLVLVVLLPQEEPLVRNAELSSRRWLLLLPLSVAAILVQAGTEELFFRGYLQQQVAARFPRWPLWMILPSALFSLLHFSPGVAGANAPFFALWAFTFGLAAADLTARTGSIGAALGFHLANNATAVLVISLPGPGAGLALFLLPFDAGSPALRALLLPELVTTLCGWLAARLALKV